MGQGAVWIAALSATLILYVLVGYPVGVALVARRRARPIRPRFVPRSVSVVLAVRNGAPWVRAKLASILALDYPRALVQIVVVSDGSTDGTDAVVDEYGDPGVELVRVPRGGKARALNAGLRHAHGEVLMFTDVRQPLDRGCLRSLVATLGDPEVGAACGHVYFLDDGDATHTSAYWRYEKWIRRSQTRLHSLAAGTGCLYAMRREFAEPIPDETLADDLLLPLGAILRGYRFVLDDGAVAYEYPTSLAVEFRRKVRTIAAVYQAIGLRPALVTPANPMWLHFISHKLGRALLPFPLIAFAVSSFALPGAARPVALAAQAGVCLLALVDPWLGRAGPVKRVSNAARTFIVLMAAALAAVSVFFVPAASLWPETRVKAPRA